MRALPSFLLLLLFDLHEKCEYETIRVGPAHSLVWQVLLTLIFLDTVNVINVKLYMNILLTGLYLFILLPVALTIFQSQSSVKQFN